MGRVLVLSVLLLAAGCRPPQPPPVALPPGSGPTGESGAMLGAINAARARARLAPLVVDGRLEVAARGQAEDCARRDALSHEGSDGSWPWDRVARAGYRASAASENGAAGQATADAAVADWMKSAGHRANVLGDWRHMGAARAAGRSGWTYRITVFARP